MAESKLLFSAFIQTTLLVILLCSTTANATIADDEKDCADQLQNLAACIPYVSGTAPKPTPECCTNAEKIRSSKPKCLCVLILESSDPSLALPINTTLALQMPAACNSGAKISNCPSILKLSPDSPNAKIFKDASGDSSTPLPASSSSSAVAATASDGSSSKMAPNNSAAMLDGKGVAVLMVSVALIFM